MNLPTIAEAFLSFHQCLTTEQLTTIKKLLMHEEHAQEHIDGKRKPETDQLQTYPHQVQKHVFFLFTKPIMLMKRDAFT